MNAPWGRTDFRWLGGILLPYFASLPFLHVAHDGGFLVVVEQGETVMRERRTGQQQDGPGHSREFDAHADNPRPLQTSPAQSAAAIVHRIFTPDKASS